MSKVFKFRLERVLQYREMLRNERKKELLEKNRAVSEAEQRLSNIRQALAGRVSPEAGVQRAQELHITSDYETRLRYEIDQLCEKISFLKLEAELAKERYIEAVKDHEALRVLKSRKLEQYKEKVNQEEMKFLDELSIQRAGRK